MKSKPVNAFIGIAITGLIIWGAMLAITWDKKDPHPLLIELGKAGATLSLVTVIGGLIQWILKNRDSAKEKEKETLNFYRNVLVDFKSVYDKVEKARLLIQAHRTAKTYGEQMRELIEGVVILHNVKRALNPGFPKLLEELKPHIDGMSGFIKYLLSEYRNNYKVISVLQEIDEARKKELVEISVRNAVVGIEEHVVPAGAWKTIENLRSLSMLKDEHFSEYENAFLNPLNQASEILRRKLPVEEAR